MYLLTFHEDWWQRWDYAVTLVWYAAVTLGRRCDVGTQLWRRDAAVTLVWYAPVTLLIRPCDVGTLLVRRCDADTTPVTLIRRCDADTTPCDADSTAEYFRA